jgi:UTP--glucose-1-phosphate uridylyltransferase
MSRREAEDHLPAFVEKMQKEGLQPLVIETFAYYYHKVLTGETGLIYDREIQPIESRDIADFKNLKKYTAAGQRVLDQTVRIVLNGGLGTTMGLTGPKSLIVAKNGKTFLEIILTQSENSGVELVLMNSFSTHDETLSALDKIRPSSTPGQFIQHKFPKIHGDVFAALNTSGMLKHLLESGIRYAFIHNLDNLGARMENSLLGYFAENRFSFMMEVAEKMPADIKGGHLARHHNGRLFLREAAQCPRDEITAFQDITRYRFFNTNNIWIQLESLKTLFEKEHTINLPMILNPKTVDPRNKSSPPVYQVETAMGAAISLFDDTAAVRVPRSRFFPVKSCNDLLALRSDCYVLEENHNLQINPNRLATGIADTIEIRLDPNFYGRIDLLDKRFKEGLPSLVDCEALSIEGDVYFESDVVIRGSVSVKNSHSSVIEGDIIF